MLLNATKAPGENIMICSDWPCLQQLQNVSVVFSAGLIAAAGAVDAAGADATRVHLSLSGASSGL